MEGMNTVFYSVLQGDGVVERANTNSHHRTYPSLRNGLTASTKPPFLLGSKDEVLPSFSPFAAPIFPPAPVIDMNATQALLNMVRTHQQGTQLDSYLKGSGKREAANAPLDLSASAPPPAKRSRKTLSESLYGTDVLPLLRAATPRPKRPSPRKKCASLCADKPCAPDSQSVSHWTVEDVAAFVSSLDMCAEYAPKDPSERGTYLLMNSCVRFVIGAPRYSHVSHHYTELRWLYPSFRRQYFLGTFLYQIINNHRPSYAYNLLHFKSAVHSLSTRSRSSDLYMPSHRSASFQNSFIVRSVNFWNSLPIKIRHSSSISTFKSLLFQFLSQKQSDTC
ncbi:unnamed protein product [Nezara viridula]|uniref:Uncharacterized protein n=1 Tax=Nezara viridula TaxID=85310 RepID=A0A9P0MTJ2_NEZVI|nr:unnamed protein product [Nezara viridula]